MGDGRSKNHKDPLLTGRAPQNWVNGQWEGDPYLNWKFKRTSLGWAIQSVSSGKFLDGRSNNHYSSNNPLLTGRDPTNDKYLNWKVERVNGGNGDRVAIRSISSNKCLDGRTAAHNNPLLSSRSPMNDKYLQWTLEVMGTWVSKSDVDMPVDWSEWYRYYYYKLLSILCFSLIVLFGLNLCVLVTKRKKIQYVPVKFVESAEESDIEAAA